MADRPPAPWSDTNWRWNASWFYRIGALGDRVATWVGGNAYGFRAFYTVFLKRMTKYIFYLQLAFCGDFFM